MNRAAPKGLLLTTIIIGLLFFIIPTTYKIVNNYKHKDYIEDVATFVQPSEHSTSDSGTRMYYLIYKYNVNGKEYYYKTDYSTSVIPEVGSEIKIKYNPLQPDQAYSNSFNVFNIFQILGLFFIFMSLIILFSNMIWLGDLFIFLFTSTMILIFITNNLYYIIVLIILGIMCFASVMDFISYLKNNDFQPFQDIKDEITKSKEIRLLKKEAKQNLSQSDIELKSKKRKRIIKGALLFLLIPLTLFIDIKWGFPNQTVYWISVGISCICLFVGFFIIGATMTGFEFKKSKVIKIILSTILSIFAIIAFFGLIYLIIEDPFEIFNNFENTARAQLFVIFGLVFLINTLYLIFNKRNYSKSQIVLYIIASILTIMAIYYNTIPEDNTKNVLLSSEFKQNLSSLNYSISSVDKIKNINVYDSEIILAQKDNTMIYYIVSNNIKTARSIYESFDINDYMQENASSSRRYAETKLENEQYLENILHKLGYGM